MLEFPFMRGLFSWFGQDLRKEMGLLKGKSTCKFRQVYLGSLMIPMFELAEGIWLDSQAHVDSPSGVRLFIRVLINKIG